MINIDKSNMFGKGNHRECYIHPDNKNLCIKIVVDDSLSDRQNQREQKYYRHLEKRNISWDMISRYHGDVTTSLGEGSVFDLITDQDGDVSKTLSYYLDSKELTEKECNSIAKLLNLLKVYLLEQRVIARLAPRNVVCQRKDNEIIQLSIIDNVGNSHFIPICNYDNFLARRKIKKEWNRFVSRMLTSYPNHKVLQLMLNSSV